jgi:hypothetical protein
MNSLPQDSSRPELCIHLGTYKTGSTAIQTCMESHRKQLLEQGVLYPLFPGDGQFERNHGKLDSGFLRLLASGADAYVTSFVDKLSLLVSQERPRLVVLSAESFWPRSMQYAALMVSTLRPLFSRVSVVIYLRHQLDLWISLHSQQAKTLRVKPGLPAWNSPEIAGQDIVGHGMFYDRVLDVYRSLLGEQNVHARLYDVKQFPDGDIVNDFFDVCGVKPFDRNDALARGTDARSINPNWGWKAVEFSKLYAVDETYGALLSRQRSIKAVGKTVHTMSLKGFLDWRGKPANYLTSDEQAAICSFYAESNDMLSNKYFDGRPVFGAKSNLPITARQLAELPVDELHMAINLAHDIYESYPA